MYHLCPCESIMVIILQIIMDGRASVCWALLFQHFVFINLSLFSVLVKQGLLVRCVYLCILHIICHIYWQFSHQHSSVWTLIQVITELLEICVRRLSLYHNVCVCAIFCLLLFRSMLCICQQLYGVLFLFIFNIVHQTSHGSYFFCLP